MKNSSDFSSKLGSLTLSHITVSSLIPGKGAPLHAAFAAHDRFGNFVHALKLRRSYASSGELPPAAPGKWISGETVYAGYMNPHFGHFLIEGLARAWYLRAHPEARICWHIRGRRFPDWKADIFSLLGISRDRFILIDQPLTFEHLIVPDAGAILGSYYHPAQSKAMAVWPFTRPRTGKRVWLSRSRLVDGNSSVEGQSEIEERLKALGWHIFFPEEHRIADQLAMLADAEVIAGIEGSAFHLLLLGSMVQARVVIATRGRQLYHSYEMIANSMRLNQCAVTLPMREIGGKHRQTQFEITDVDGATATIECAASCKINAPTLSNFQ